MDAFINGDDNDAAVAKIVENISKGKPIGLDEDKLEKTFCVLGLAPNAARISVRFFTVTRSGNSSGISRRIMKGCKLKVRSAF